MNTGKSYKQILNDSIERTRLKLEQETNPQKRLIMSFHIQYLTRQTKKKHKGTSSIGGKVCDIADTL